MYDMATGKRARGRRGAPTPPDRGVAETAPPLHRAIADHAAELISEELTKQVERQITNRLTRKVDKVVVTAARTVDKHADKLHRLEETLGPVETWTRGIANTRKPRLNRTDIATAAVRIADTEGLEALSMRRLAAELDVGTMSLYHYVRTKDELLTLVMDAIIAEILVPRSSRLPRDWRSAISVIARRTRDTLLQHPWVLDISDDPPIGPNALLHFEQTHEALASMDAGLEHKLDLITAIDAFVFGHCLHTRNNLHVDEAGSDRVLEYVGDLFESGNYPILRDMVESEGLEQLWNRIHRHYRDPDRFERNLARLLDGFDPSRIGGAVKRNRTHER